MRNPSQSICVCVTLLYFVLCGATQADDALSRAVAAALQQSPVLALSHSGRWLALKGHDGSVIVTDTFSGHQSQLRGGRDAALSGSWSRDDRRLVIARHSSFSVYEFPAGRLIGVPSDADGISDVEISPDAHYVSAIKNHALWLAKMPGGRLMPLIDGGNPSLLEGEADGIYASEFDTGRHYWWSPDSSAIAFIETEFSADHYPLPGATLPIFRLKVIDVGSGRIRTIAASDDQWPYLLRVTWHPDGHRLVFYRMNRPQTEAELRLSDGPSLNTVLAERDAYWINPPARPQFTSNDGMVVTSERSGANHIYLYGLNGAELRDLTPSGVEVYALHASIEVRDRIYITAAEGDKQEQHLFRIESPDGDWKKLTDGEGRHESLVADAGGGFLDSYSTATRAPMIRWHDASGATRPVAAVPPGAATVTDEFRPFRLHDGTLLPARLFKPAQFDARRTYPLIVYVAPGPRGRVAANSWGGWQMAWNRYMVGQGYLVLAVDPRGSGGYGHLFEEYIHYRPGAQETVDLREVFDLLKRQSYVDPQRIGIWGCDYGAYVVVRSMLDSRDTFKAAFADSAIVDMGKYDAYFAERYLGLPLQHGFEYYDSLAVKNARRITGTLMLASSPKNPLIRPSHLEALRIAIDQAKKKHPAIDLRFRVWNSDDADYREKPKDLAALFAVMKQFFDETL